MVPLTADIFEEDEEAIADSDYDEEEMYEHAEDTRLRYERLQARGRVMELAYQRRQEAEAAQNDTRRERSRSHSKSRSRPATPITALFKRDAFVLGVTRSQSPPVNNSGADKS